jgi:ribosomal-protein-serine acetyltransferase
MLRFHVTQDCHLRLFEEADAEEFYRVIETNRPYLAPWMPWAANQTLEGTAQFIRLTRRQIADNNGFQTPVICAGRIAGVVGFHGVDWTNNATSIGYWLDQQQQARGIMTRSVRALVEHALGAWKLNRVEIRVAPDNVRSRAIPERLGFRQEGVLHGVERIGDRYLDAVVYAMLASAWPATDFERDPQ